MIPAAIPHSATPLAEPAASGASASGPARADDAAAREFAALLGAMMQPPVAGTLPVVTRVAVDDLADAATGDAAEGQEGGTSVETADRTPTAQRSGGPDAAASAHAAIDASINAAIKTPINTPTNGEARASATETRAAAARGASGSRAESASAAGSTVSNAASTSSERSPRRVAGTAGAAHAPGAALPTAATTAPAAATANVIASTSALDADFADRLDRVLDRMRQAGHRVDVRETLRAPERQQALYEQGRTTAGPVVTWTLDSRHLAGKAADVRVDGRSAGPGYDLLHAIAKEEGLRTLGARDPGHLELPRTTADTDRHTASPAVLTEGGVARVARVAQVAQVATVARIAAPNAQHSVSGPAASAAARAADAERSMRVAALPALRVPSAGTVAAGAAPRAAGASGPEATERARAMSDLTGSTVPMEDSATAPTAPTVSRTSSEAERDHSRQESGSRAARQARGRSTAAHVDPTSRAGMEPLRDSMPIHVTRGAPLSGSSPIAQPGSLAAERVAELLAARDAQPAGALGELRLTMDPVRDGLHEVRLALQNGALDATLRTSDAGFARGLQSEIASLTRSLERQGFDAARVAVQVDAAQQARATALDTVAATEATARERELRGDSDASREGREQHAAHDARRDQQHARQFGSRRPHPF